MKQESHNEEQVLAKLKTQTAVYIELPFNTGDFLVIAHYKLIAHYRQMVKQAEGDAPDQSLVGDELKRKELHEEVLFHLDKVLSLSSLSEEQLEQLREFRTLHEKLLQEIILK